MSKYGKVMSRFTFTWNNYSEENVINLKKLTYENIKYLIFGKEIGECGTPHLQGYVELWTRQRETGVKKILDPILKLKSKIHIEIAGGTRADSIRYCSKGEQSKTEFEEFKLLEDFGPNYGKNADVYEMKTENNSETTFADILEKAKHGAKFVDILEDHPEECIKYHHGIDRVITEQKKQIIENKLNKEMEKMIPRTWQQNLLDEMKNFIDGSLFDDRSIIWYYDKDGCAGKSSLIDLAYYHYSEEVCVIENGRSADIAESYNGETIVIVDLSRTIQDHINYGAIESLKNKHSYKSKWHSGSFRHPSPMIVVMANFKPKYDAFSLDRWDIRELRGFNKIIDVKNIKKTIIYNDEGPRGGNTVDINVSNAPPISQRKDNIDYDNLIDDIDYDLNEI
ncbi:replication-associated protein [Crucivirus-339]|nr:replication-associated protein [Crucivirus-339]